MMNPTQRLISRRRKSDDESTSQKGFLEPPVFQKEYLMTGKTTFQNLLDWGVPQEVIEQVLGEAMPAPQTLVKDYATGKGIAFSELKGKLQVEVDQHK